MGEEDKGVGRKSWGTTPILAICSTGLFICKPLHHRHVLWSTFVHDVTLSRPEAPRRLDPQRVWQIGAASPIYPNRFWLPFCVGGTKLWEKKGDTLRPNLCCKRRLRTSHNSRVFYTYTIEIVRRLDAIKGAANVSRAPRRAGAPSPCVRRLSLLPAFASDTPRSRERPGAIFCVRTTWVSARTRAWMSSLSF